MTDNKALGAITNIASPSIRRQQIRLDRWYMQTAAAKLLPKERVASCMRYKAPQYDAVNVLFDTSKKQARYKHLMLCTSVWMCPVCAANISEGRRVELEKAISKTGLTPLLITYTLSHRVTNTLQFTLWRLMRAFDLFKNGKQWVSLAHNYGWKGSVRALEITYGANGWHPHLHELAFVEHIAYDDLPGVRSALAKRWQDKVEKAGGSASLGHGLDLKKSWKDVAEYVAKFGHQPANDKWDLSEEVTKGTSKVSAKEGRTPFMLLWDYANGDGASGALFEEYALTMKGRNQLTWSRGLRDLLGMTEPEPEDQELVDEPVTETEQVMLSLDNDAWTTIRKAGKRTELLEICEMDDKEALLEYLTSLGLEIVEGVVGHRLPW